MFGFRRKRFECSVCGAPVIASFHEMNGGMCNKCAADKFVADLKEANIIYGKVGPGWGKCKDCGKMERDSFLASFDGRCFGCSSNYYEKNYSLDTTSKPLETPIELDLEEGIPKKDDYRTIYKTDDIKTKEDAYKFIEARLGNKYDIKMVESLCNGNVEIIGWVFTINKKDSTMPLEAPTGLIARCSYCGRYANRNFLEQHGDLCGRCWDVDRQAKEMYDVLVKGEGGESKETITKCRECGKTVEKRMADKRAGLCPECYTADERTRNDVIDAMTYSIQALGRSFEKGKLANCVICNDLFKRTNDDRCPQCRKNDKALNDVDKQMLNVGKLRDILRTMGYELGEIEVSQGIESKTILTITAKELDLLNADIRELQNAKESIEKKVNELANKIRRS